jgi:hypothetical protein
MRIGIPIPLCSYLYNISLLQGEFSFTFRLKRIDSLEIHRFSGHGESISKWQFEYALPVIEPSWAHALISLCTLSSDFGK